MFQRNPRPGNEQQNVKVDHINNVLYGQSVHNGQAYVPKEVVRRENVNVTPRE
jgi:hypothetical protein